MRCLLETRPSDFWQTDGPSWVTVSTRLRQSSDKGNNKQKNKSYLRIKLWRNSLDLWVQYVFIVLWHKLCPINFRDKILTYFNSLLFYLCICWISDSWVLIKFVQITINKIFVLIIYILCITWAIVRVLYMEIQHVAFWYLLHTELWPTTWGVISKTCERLKMLPSMETPAWPYEPRLHVPWE